MVAGKTYLYTYDNAGNITSKKTYPYTIASTASVASKTPTATYTYTYDNNWGDRLSSYRGASFTYDSLGNPTSYYNGASYTMRWQKGRQLSIVTKGSSYCGFTYDAEGRRTSKLSFNGRVIEYLWDGDLLIGEYIAGQKAVTYTYDATGSPVGFTYTDLTGYYESVPCSFLYRKNAQGDIIGIVDSSGNEFVKYNYDAWGNLISYTMHGDNLYSLHYNLAEENPFRYRGYYYDTEIGLYYLNSRYYNPEVGRFINGDDVMMQCSSVDSHGYCAWSYCKNGPVGTVDAYGYDTQSVLKEIDKYIGETWIARLLKKNISKIKNGKCYLFNEGVGNTRAKLYLEYKVRKPSDNWPIKLTTKSFEAALGKANFKLGWWGKLESSFGISIGRYTMGIMRGIDWKKRYISIYISYVTKDKKMEFTTVLFFSVSNLLILAVSGVVVGLCVVLPALAPAFLGMVGAFAAKAKIFASICTSVLYAMQVAYA